eukprot:1474153-Rhodomonas_salina.4
MSYCEGLEVKTQREQNEEKTNPCDTLGANMPVKPPFPASHCASMNASALTVRIRRLRRRRRSSSHDAVLLWTCPPP